MTIPIKEIIDFHIKRTNCHIQALNYFAEIIGYHFPEHDNDKFSEPYITGYAYCNYAKHHLNCTLLPQQQQAFDKVHDDHHKMQPHHVEHYASMKDIPDIFLIEMICDWFSANFEQNFITKAHEFSSVQDFFDKSMSHLDWSSKQKKLINNLIAKISQSANYDDVKKIWEQINNL